MQKFPTLLAIATLFLICACGKPVNVSAPYTAGQYRISSVELLVTDPAQPSDPAFNEKFRQIISNAIIAKMPTNSAYPEIYLSINLRQLNHSTALGYNAASTITLVEPSTRRAIGMFEESYAAPSSASPATGGGFAGAILGGFMTAGLTQAIDGDESSLKTNAMMQTYANQVATHLFLTK